MPAIGRTGKIRVDACLPLRLRGGKGGSGLVSQMAGGACNLGNAGARLFDLSANAFFELLNVGKLNVWGWTLSSDTLRLYLWPQIGGLVLQALQGLLDPFFE